MKMNHLLVPLATLSLLGGCANLNGDNEAAKQAQLDQLVNQQTEQLQTLIVDTCTPKADPNQPYMEQLVTEMAGVNAQLTALVEKQAVPVVTCPEVSTESPIGDKLILGEVERTYVQEVGMEFETRVDTGAESSSIDARNITLFERDGKQWVRFDVPNREAPETEAKTIEAKVERIAQIKKGAADGKQERPVIRARLKIGDYVADTELNLNDRSHLDYPLLLGRKFIKDIAVVDVSRSHVQSKKPAKKPAKPTE
ncbi:ATP-dependent zinc protease family protein [Ferrimonas kyonanensis]|uniref:ATP-dependent zinc protease family protein n=1 Tax=Ferrimonas kyonanensis TaxID=364763 RepID=UPI000425D74C|nr:ATP-dependent zinc protease [Ferrimonas kyonanensis]